MVLDRVGAWREVLDKDDREALAGYARARNEPVIERAALIVIDVTEAFVGPNLPGAQAQTCLPPGMR